jgi:hypothetical protein
MAGDARALLDQVFPVQMPISYKTIASIVLSQIVIATQFTLDIIPNFA